MSEVLWSVFSQKHQKHFNSILKTWNAICHPSCQRAWTTLRFILHIAKMYRRKVLIYSYKGGSQERFGRHLTWMLWVLVNLIVSSIPPCFQFPVLGCNWCFHFSLQCTCMLVCVHACMHVHVYVCACVGHRETCRHWFLPCLLFFYHVCWVLSRSVL